MQYNYSAEYLACCKYWLILAQAPHRTDLMQNVGMYVRIKCENMIHLSSLSIYVCVCVYVDGILCYIYFCSLYLHFNDSCEAPCTKCVWNVYLLIETKHLNIDNKYTIKELVLQNLMFRAFFECCAMLLCVFCIVSVWRMWFLKGDLLCKIHF